MPSFVPIFSLVRFFQCNSKLRCEFRGLDYMKAIYMAEIISIIRKKTGTFLGDRFGKFEAIDLNRNVPEIYK